MCFSAFDDFKQLLLDTHDERRSIEVLFQRLEEGSPLFLCKLPYFHGTPPVIKLVQCLCFYVLIGDATQLLDEATTEFVKLCESVHKFAFDAAFAPIMQEISSVGQMEVTTANLYSFRLENNINVFILFLSLRSGHQAAVKMR